MGGNALKIKTVRKTTSEYNMIANKLIPIIKKGFNTDVSLVKCYHNKESHGDMDILVKMGYEQVNINIIDFIKNNFNPSDINNNNGVISFDYDNFQIDIIPISQGIWDIANIWFSYDPFSNLVGKIVKQFNIKI